ncbi:ABC transporter permease [Polycladidibacter hongkongensis]|uniref:ABC transporter permease n=1 Tax=Polycladidibacter hongkongensis TaxID=1647556 RepID=UPI000833FF39|nr:ABC transporter permease subunit [Pseudovibrio hongkongensis]
MNSILAIAACEFRISRRNNLLRATVAMMVLFAVSLTVLGSGATGALGVDMLTAASASLATLSVYIVPLIALLLSFDAIAGEVDRGTLALVLSYPAPRTSLVIGKLLAHLLALGVALVLGYGAAIAVCLALGTVSTASLLLVLKLTIGGLLLGAAFLGLGYALSAWAKGAGAAAGYAIGIWLVFVVLYDVALLAGLVLSGADGAFTQDFFPWLLIANPADAFRLVTLPTGQAAELASGFVSADLARSYAPMVSLLAWPLAALGLAAFAMRRVEP